MKFQHWMIACLMIATTILSTLAPDSNFASAQTASTAPTGARAAQAQLENSILVMERELTSLFEKQAELEVKRKLLLEKQGDYLLRQDSLGVSAESFAEIIKVLQTQRVDLMIDLAGLQARQAVMAEIQDKSAAKNSEALIKPLEEMLALSKENFMRIEQMISQGTVSVAERNEAKMKILSIQLQIAQARQASGDSKFGSELINLSLDKAEKQARLEKTELLLRDITESRESISASRKIEIETKSLENELQLFQSRSSRIEEQLKLLRQQLDDAKAVTQSGADR